MIFLDTTVWVAAFSDRHPHHEASRLLLAENHENPLACAAHSVAEVYATLTRLPAEARAHPREAMDFLQRMQQRCAVILLDAQEYLGAIEAMSRRAIVGAMIYDALILACARKAQATWIHTWNPRHFRLVAPDLAERIVTPDGAAALKR